MKYCFNTNEGLNISIPFHDGIHQVNCFYAPYFSVDPVRMGDFIGSVQEGGAVNFTNIKLNVHGNGTHTECVGHISKEIIPVNKIIKSPFASCTLISIYPTKRENGDLVIEKSTLEQFLNDFNSDALCIRTLPNDVTKKSRKYSGINPCYISSEAMQYLVELKVKHLLVDIPSVDREEDGGKLEAHRIFWSGDRANDCTITELIYVQDNIRDGSYLLLLQICSMDLDAVPSSPMLFSLSL
ncbi:MAG: cyclase family protein [Saprospiraceae bacterium]|nr:cyclase family protein [Saprospiraceae bacterium]